MCFYFLFSSQKINVFVKQASKNKNLLINEPVKVIIYCDILSPFLFFYFLNKLNNVNTQT